MGEEMGTIEQVIWWGCDVAAYWLTSFEGKM